jgi:hypothetical protein
MSEHLTDSRVGKEEAGEHLESGGLARTVGSEKPDDLALTDVKGGSFDGDDDFVLAGDQASQ